MDPTLTHAGTEGKPFLYLAQGKGPLPAHYADLVSARSDLIHLTWGEPVEGAIHFPGSSWTEGRNRLLQEALARPERPLYFILLDDDVVFEKGDWRLFEDELLKHRPAAATPYYPLYTHGALDPLPGVEAQTCLWYDAMCTAFHRDVVEDGLLLPYYTGLDKLSWVYSQWFVIYLSRILYPGHVLQLNRVWIANAKHENDYEEGVDFGVSAGLLFAGVLRRRYVLKRAQRSIKRSFGIPEFVPRRASAPPRSYRLTERAKRRWLNLDAVFWRVRRPISSV